MNFRQLQIFCRLADCDFNISKTARLMFTSQPNVSRHLRALENELGVGLLVRSPKRVLALTDAGLEALQAARRAIREIEGISRIGERGARERGNLTIAASHAHARYSLPEIVSKFAARHPGIRLVLQQGSPDQTAAWVGLGQADLAITSEVGRIIPNLVLFPCHKHSRILLVPKNHPLAHSKRPSLDRLAKFPLITYNASFSVHRRVEEAFSRRGLAPNIVLSATDADVMKTYVRQGLGVAIVASIAFSQKDDKDLRRIDADHLFDPNTINIGLRKGTYLKPYVYDFIELFAPMLKRAQIESALFDL